MNTPDPFDSDMRRSTPDRLNQTCLCVTLDRAALAKALEREARDPVFVETFIRPRPHLFSNVPVFLSAKVVAEMQECVSAIETTLRLPSYQAAVLSWAPQIAQRDHGPVGALMGYDFHLGGDGPRLIEVNTNAGGAFLNALLARAQRTCCAVMEPQPSATGYSFEDAVFRMFRDEWRRQRGTGTLQRIAIVDDSPEEQYLYPEFVLASQVLTERGVEAFIAEACGLRYDGGRLSFDGQNIDLVYNRLTDFAFERPEHKALREAYRDDAVVVTPNPHNHALVADKRNLTLLSDPVALEGLGLASGPRAILSTLVPRTIFVTTAAADVLWKSRKNLFFKPTGGHGGKAVYRGDKVTKGVWAKILQGGYVAQTLVRPSERMIKVDDAVQTRKLDVRFYTYEGRVLLAAARLYQGQTTNFQTPGGGFAPVFAI
jgi:hypothetical protein